MSTALIIYRNAWYYLSKGLYFQAWLMLVSQAKRAMRRRKHFVITKGIVKNA